VNEAEETSMQRCCWRSTRLALLCVIQTESFPWLIDDCVGLGPVSMGWDMCV
jgi:hypothetical protein